MAIEKKDASYRDGARNDFRDADVLLFRGTGLFSAFIRKISHSEYSHVGLVVLQHGRVLCAESTGQGVQLKVMSTLVEQYHGGIDYFELNATDEQREKALHFVFGQLGKPYDNGSGLRFAMALMFGTTRKHVDNDEWFCSELVAQAFRAADMHWFDGQATDYISPGDLSEVDDLTYRHTLKK